MHIQTYTGQAFDLLRPTPAMIHLEDIAHALSQLVRFTGHAMRRYSIAEHCIHVASLVPMQFQREALLHDASEAYISDISTPLKHAANMEGYRRIEANLEAVIAERFGLSRVAQTCVHRADLLMLAVEATQLLRKPLIPAWDTLLAEVGELPAVEIHCWSAWYARARFLQACRINGVG